MIIDISYPHLYIPKNDSINIPESELKNNIDYLNSLQEITFVCKNGMNARRIAYLYSKKINPNIKIFSKKI